MEHRYVGRDVDLSLLSQWVSRFLKRKGFIVTTEETERGPRVIAKPTHVHEIIDVIRISILGTAEDFVVRFVVGARSKFFMKFGLLTQWLGGGFAFLRGAKSQDEEDELERRFWIFIQEKIELLAGSSRDHTPV